ncbi:MAG: hypothetical protein KGY67_09275, partial [Candidatus Thermoplasmatota archaeon]|nr:hypothetical protein [Candidatus Thermoplasmatota archaeon]
ERRTSTRRTASNGVQMSNRPVKSNTALPEPEAPAFMPREEVTHGEILINNDNRKRVQFESRVYDEYLDFKYYLDQYNSIRRKRLSL